MELITYLPNSIGHAVIWVTCDRLTKYAYFVALPTKFSTIDLTLCFLVEIFRLHEVPKSKIFYCDPLSSLAPYGHFLNKRDNSQILHNISPKNIRENEVVNWCLETYLRCFAKDQPRH